MLRELLEECCQLQKQYSKQNTPAMQRRGVIIRDEVPGFFENYRQKLSDAVGVGVADFNVHGRDGTGNKAFVPWVRLHSQELSPRAHDGWYCGYLFSFDGSGVYLSLCHASTRWEHGSPRILPKAELKQQTEWGREILGPDVTGQASVVLEADLRLDAAIVNAYKASMCLSRHYRVGDIPSDQQLIADALQFTNYLSLIYRQVRLGQNPDADHMRERAFVTLIEQIQVGGATGQGFGLNAKERKAVELRAMEVTRNRLGTIGFTAIEDTSSRKSWDFEGSYAGKIYKVEVKGTTGKAASVIITDAEVRAQRAHFPYNVLVVVENIQLVRSTGTENPTASGGDVRVLMTWDISEAALSSIAYRYQTPTSGWL